MRLYRALLRLYPASFRAEYGVDMTAVFARQLRDADGLAATAVLWLDTLREVLVDAVAIHWDVLRNDLRYARRSLARSPGFTLTVVLVAAIGIGANTAAFSVTDFVLLRPLDYPRGDRLVKLWQRAPGYARFELSPTNYRDWKRQATSFSSMGAGWAMTANLTVAGADPERLTGAAVTWDLLPTLGVGPAIGRTFTQDEDREGAAGTILLSNGLWHRLFGGRPEAVGRTLMLDGATFTVIGVMPAGFAYPSRQTSFWRPIQFPAADTDRTNTYLQVVARLNDGVAPAAARSELEAIASRLAEQFPKENENIGAALVPMRDDVPRQSRMLTIALSGAALCVLLIVCANLANLLITRALGRRKELAVRAAIGAGRDRLVRQLATETALLAIAGGVFGVLLAYVSVPALAQLAPVSLPTAAQPEVNLRVLMFAAVLTLVTAAAFGVAPAIRLGRDVDTNGLREGARGGARRERMRAVLVIAEVSASIVLLVGAGLLLKALLTVGRVNPGFDPESVLTMRTVLPWPTYAPTEKRAQFYDQVLDAVRAMPGVTSAAYTSGLPMIVRGGIWSIAINGEAGAVNDSVSVSLRYVTPGMFRTLGIPVLAGRDASDTDGQKTPFAAVISESLARRQWPGENPLGKRFTVAFFERTVVGVVGDVRMRGPESSSEPQVYIPYRQIPDGFMPTFAPRDLAIKTTLPPDRIVPAVRAIVRRADPQEPVSDVQLLSDVVSRETLSREDQLRAVMAFAAMAALLAAVGIHGLLAFGVSQRIQEFGVRMAVGAEPGQVAWLVLKQGARLAFAGAIPGLLLAWVAGRSLAALLAGVSPADPITYASAAALVIAMTLAGSLAPALRAFRVNPIEALRTGV